MSLYSHIVDDEVYDWCFLKREQDTLFVLRHGQLKKEDILIGQLFYDNRKKSYGVVCHHTPCEYGYVRGFKTRHDAAEFMLQVCYPRKRDLV